MTPSMKRKNDSYPDLLEIEYRLAELPSAQHRAGLAGLVLMAGWIKQEYVTRGICDLEVTEKVVTLYLDLLGLSELFNGLYAATREEQQRLQPVRNQRTREVIPPLREEVREGPDPESGRMRLTKYYVYETIVPKGAFLAELDPSVDEEDGLWIRLWREVVWSILRSVPATRRPYEARANDERSNDYETVWHDLRRGWDHAVSLPGTYFIGAQSITAERLPFRDRARHQFLLNFWPLVAQVYVPVLYGPENDLNLRGFVLAVPDVRRVDLFGRLFPPMLKARSSDPYRPRQYRPAGSIIDLVEEAGLDLLRRLGEEAAPLTVGEIIDGVELFHLEREGNSVRQLQFCRVEPEEGLIEAYRRVKMLFHHPGFRRQQLVNILGEQDLWYAGYDRLLEQLPLSQTLMNGPFRRDVEAVFAWVERETGPGDETLVFRAVVRLLAGAASDEARSEPDGLTLRQFRTRLARELFLGVRARRGRDFIEYFLSQIHSARRMDSGRQRGEPCRDRAAAADSNGGWEELEVMIEKRPDRIRTLTMLALIAAVAGTTVEEDGNDVS